MERGLDLALRRELGVSELIGVDEAGRGPLAGPVVVAAVLLGPQPCPELKGVRDSKVLTAARREALFEPIRRRAQVAVAWAQPNAIDRLNILAATLWAMRRAVLRLGSTALVLVDGNRRIPELAQPQRTVVGADAKSLAVACASIVAKVARDRWMRSLDRRYPGYGLARHKGYPTREHRRTLFELGPSPSHRLSFAPVRLAALSSGTRPR
ncbi:MAG: ribonuclease HII [Elusimicrobia bacterium]|nr:ribonuclease HII [Elusimicrobiota bacterium]MDE2237709.1 ribonuclease HII [Elusimicrobiota bacterium]MDE2426376.1 ribonuclease HII [Elusimicrobiota bacterium]